RDAFAALGQAGEVFLYTLNPCREFWEDLDHARVRRAPAADPRFPKRRGNASQLSLLFDEGERSAASPDPRQIDFAPDHPDEIPALALWARPGRENIALHNQLS